MELKTQNSTRSRMRFFSRRSSSIGSNVSFKSVGSTISFSSADSGSKDETFFESKNFESDADEEFHSVHGGSTPGSDTPNSYSRTASSNLNKSVSIGPTASNIEKETASPSDQKAKLVDLLKDEQDRIKQEHGAQSSNNLKMEKLSSIASRGSTLDEEPSQSQLMRNRSLKAAPCCLPCLIFHSCSKDRRKMKTGAGS